VREELTVVGLGGGVLVVLHHAGTVDEHINLNVSYDGDVA
jgi:hypothetical protein